MKALILAAGFGTRLLPYTKTIPKPLFPVNNLPIIGHTIEKLIKAGISEIFINTHHLSKQIDSYIEQNNYPVKVKTIFEPQILDTGGAIKNLKPFIQNSSFIVINSDIFFEIDLKELIKKHHDDNHLIDLVLHKHEKYNKISIDSNDCVLSFDSSSDSYAFIGIHIISPKIFSLMPEKNIFSIIDFYKELLNKNIKIHSMTLENAFFWEDIGTIGAYKNISIQHLIGKIESISPDCFKKIKIKQICGDGSDRQWFRAKTNKNSYIAADHGIIDLKNKPQTSQLDSFVHIGNHLYKNKIPVPKILNFDEFSGIAMVEDLGDIHLEKIINNSKDPDTIFNWYKKVCDLIFDFSIKGNENFQNRWTYETDEYTKEFILERECKYFLDSFVNSYLKKEVRFETLLPEFEFIADNCTHSSFKGLMHRDMQSKNIMIKNNEIFFIDFQSARKGPVEYDIASLLIDPYVKLDNNIRDRILNYLETDLIKNKNINEKQFKHCYKYCCVSRNLQVLGAYSFLSLVKNKRGFEKYIPYALNSLKINIKTIETDKVPELNKLINNLRA